MQGVIDVFLQKIATGEEINIWGDGSAVRDFIFIDDVVEAVGRLIHLGVKNEIVNIGSGAGITVRDVLEVIKKTVGREFTIRRMNRYAGVTRSVLNIHKLQKLADWRPGYSLRQGIAEAWRRLTVENDSTAS
jgi:UDP-glucose 4-epimerase